MSRNVIEQFAASYPRQKVEGYASTHSEPAKSNTGTSFENLGTNSRVKQPCQLRTPLADIMVEGFKASTTTSQDRYRQLGISQGEKDGMKKFFAVLLIVFIGAFLYSSFAYTLSDGLFTKFNMQLFDSGGQPSIAIVVVHSVIFMAMIYLITSALKLC